MEMEVRAFAERSSDLTFAERRLAEAGRHAELLRAVRRRQRRKAALSSLAGIVFSAVAALMLWGAIATAAGPFALAGNVFGVALNGGCAIWSLRVAGRHARSAREAGRWLELVEAEGDPRALAGLAP